MTQIAAAAEVFDTFWTWFVIAGFALFAVAETAAFVTGRPKQYTLSAWVWRHIGTRGGWRGWHIPARLTVLLGLLWLAEHFTFGWF